MTGTPAGFHRNGGVSLERLVQRLRSHQLPASELMDVCLQEIDDRDGDVHAFVHVDAEGARRRAESATASGLRGGDARPLAGIPFACKDTIDVFGMPTGYGTTPDAARYPHHNAHVVDALIRAGAICVGKLATTEFAGGDYRDPAPCNPWNLLRGAGGSSGGSAAAVAAGFVPIALAADTGGSARIPASFCGVCALRPGRETLSFDGVAPLSPSFDQVGWIAPDPTDLASLWTALDVGDGSSPHPRGGGSTYRIAVVAPWADLHDDVAAAVTRLVAELPGTGIETSHVVLAHGRTAAAAAWVVTYTEAARIYGSLVRRRRAELTPSFVRKIEGARYFDGRDLDRAHEIGRCFSAEVDEVLATADALLLPTVPMTAPLMVDSSYASDVAIFTRPISITSCVSLSVPAGLGRDGLPVGVQLVSARADTTRLLALAAFVQEHNLLGQSTLTSGASPHAISASPSEDLDGQRERESVLGDDIEAAARAEATDVQRDLWTEEN